MPCPSATGPQTDSLTSSATGTSTPAAEDFFYDRDALWAYFDSRPAALKDTAKIRLAIVINARSLIDSGIKKNIAWKIATEGHDIHPRSAARWYDSIKNYDTADWLPALCPGYAGRGPSADISDEAWEFFKADYLRLEQPALKACYRRLKRVAQERGWTVPSEGTLMRRIKQIPRSVRVLKREGELALLRMYPPQQRSVRDLQALQWINGDGYQHNVFVLMPDGSIVRLKTWYWQDVYSRKILAWRTDVTENTDMIRLAFGDLISEFGIPQHVTIDNTRAAANKWMTGGVANRYRFKVKEDDPLGIITMFVGPKNIHWTSVNNTAGPKKLGHGQAKPVERSFGNGGIGEVIDKHPAFSGAYTGNNPAAKPEDYGTRAVPYADFIRIHDEEIAAWNAQPGRRTEMAGGIKSFDEVFNESYSNATIHKATAEQRRLCLLCAESVTVLRDSTISLDAGSATGMGRNRYRSPALIEMIGNKVVVRFDPDNLHNEVYLYTLDNRFIDTAICIDASGFGDTRAGREHKRARTQFIRATKAAAAAEVKMSAIQTAGYLPQQHKSVAPEVKVVRPFRSPISNKPRELNNREKELLQEMQQGEVPVFEIPRTDPEKHQLWTDLHARLSAGESLADDEQRFYDAWQRSIYFKVSNDIENDLAVKAN